MPPPEPTIRIRGLNHHFGAAESKKQVLFDIDLDLAPSQIVLLTGPSGSGKTTLLTLIGALRSVQEGEVTVLGRDYARLDEAERVLARRSIGFIFQAHNLFESLTALRNVRLAFELQGTPRGEQDAMAAEILGRVGLRDRLHYKPQKLSGGQRQRVAIARAVAARPRLILADEPTAALDEDSGRAVIELLQEQAQQDGATVLIVTHDNRVLGYADRILSMVDGRVVSDVLVKQALEICEFLRKCSLFEAMTPEELTEVSQQMTVERFPMGEAIIRQGDEGDKFYVVRDGTVDVVVARDGAEETVGALTVGDSFGEAALLTGDPRNATIVATSPVEVYALDAPSFRAATERSHTFVEQLREVFFKRM